MCGLAGILGDRSTLQDLASIARSIENRGPDHQATLKIDGGVLAQSRLAIQDVSPKANLPMRDDTGRYLLLFNGEIYNHLDLRRTVLNQSTFSTRSDSETLLQLCITLGPLEACRCVAGMFAFAMFDLQSRRLYLARDQLGEKPLYLAHQAGRRLVFASDISALIGEHALSDDAVLDYLVLGFVPQDTTVLDGVRPVPTGTLMTFDMDRLDMVACETFHQSQDGTPDQDQPSGFSETLGRVIDQNAASDRGLGLFLSGGIDSSLIAYHLAQSGRRFHAYTFKAEGRSIDESQKAKQLSEKLHFGLTEIRATQQDLREAISVIAHLDQPFADPSALATCLMARHVSETDDIKVILSGDGADELFYGYNRQILHANRVWRALSEIRPAWLRGRIQELSALAAQLGYRLSGRRALLKLGLILRNMARYDTTLSGFLAAYGHYAFPACFINAWARRFACRLGTSAQDPLEIDRTLYLPGNVLVKSDKILMQYGLEGRSPFCDARIVRLARSTGPDQQVRHGKGKMLLRDLCKQYLPGKTARRSKQGFSMPLKDWVLQEHFMPLSEVTNSYGGRLLKRAGVDVADMVRRVGGSNSYHVIIWRIAVLEQWLRAHGRAVTAS